MQIYKRTGKSDTAKDAYITCKLVIKQCPIDIGIEKFFQDKYHNSSGISQEVCRYDKETYIPTDLETSDKAVEKDSLECQIGYIQAQTLDKQPYDR